MPTSDIQTLLDKQAIYEVVCRFARGADRLDIALMRSCFHAGAQLHYAGFEGPIEDGLEMAKTFLGSLDGTMHSIANHLVELDGDRAVSEAYVNSYHWGTPRTDPAKNFRTGTRYLDRFERRNGEWRIAERFMLRSFGRSEADAGQLDVPDAENKWPPSLRSAEDPVYRVRP